MQSLHDAGEMVDLGRYPIADMGSTGAVAFIRRCRAAYLETGLCMLPGFIAPHALRRLAREANAVAHQAYFCDSTHNAYLTDEDTELASDDAARWQEHTYVGSVAYDRIGRTGLLRHLYLWDPLKDFIAGVLGKDRLFRFADPLGACSINVFVDGGQHGWHFDESEFTVTLMLQAPEAGGSFEYVPKIRGLDDEHAILTSVLNGDRARVVHLPFEVGTLLIFGGRQTLHRVTRVEGTRSRLVPVLCYAQRQGLTNSETVRQLFWGRTHADGPVTE